MLAFFAQVSPRFIIVRPIFWRILSQLDADSREHLTLAYYAFLRDVKRDDLRAVYIGQMESTPAPPFAVRRDADEMFRLAFADCHQTGDVRPQSLCRESTSSSPSA